MKLFSRPFLFKRLVLAFLALASLVWLEASLGFVFASFVLFLFLSRKLSLIEWLLISSYFSLFLSLWFGLFWPGVFVSLFIAVWLNELLRRYRLRLTELLLGIFLTVILILIACLKLSPSSILLMAIEFILWLIFLPREKKL